jgi:hypothetical protein
MKWTPEKNEELRRRYPHEDNGRLARELGCSRKALAFRASFLGIRKTDAANEARYAALARRIAPESMEGERREIATGTVIVRGNVLTHLSNFSAAREQGRAEAEEHAALETLPPFAAARATPVGAPLLCSDPSAAKGGEGGFTQHGEPTPQITCPRCKVRYTPAAVAVSAPSLSMEA